MFPSNAAQTRRSTSTSTRSTVVPGSSTTILPSNHDENALPIGVDGIDQSAMMAGKAVGAPRRSALSTVSTNAVASIIPSETVRNLRAKTVKQTVVTAVAEDNTASATTTTSTSSESIELEKENVSNVTVFPVKTSLRSQIVDKENIAPSASKTASVSAPVDWDDLDTEDQGDPLMVSDYVVEIFEYMRNLEKSILPRSNYMVHQKELEWHMRSILVDWLIEVQWKLKLLPETLYLSINIIDRFLSCRAVSLSKLQLVGLAATLLASKYEEVVSPSINNFIFLSDNSYLADDLLNAERYILQILGFSLAYPSPMSFLRRISKAEGYDIRSRTLAKYLMEVALLDQNFVSCPPSMLAAVGIYAARLMLKCGPWNANLIHYSGYQDSEIKRYSNRLIHFLQQPQQYLAIHRKYSSKKYMKASVFVYDWMKRHFPAAPALEKVYYLPEGSASESA